MLALHVEVGCPRTWRLGLLTLKPGSKSTQKHCPTRHQATSPAHHIRSSMEITITVITNNNNNDNDNDNDHAKVIKIKRERTAGENTKTLQKLIRTPQTLSTEKLRPHVMAYA